MGPPPPGHVMSPYVLIGRPVRLSWSYRATASVISPADFVLLSQASH